MGAPLMGDEARAIAAEPGHVVAAAGGARRAAVPARAIAKEPQTAFVREIREPVEILRRRWAVSSFLHDLGPPTACRPVPAGAAPVPGWRLPVPTLSIILCA